MGHTNYPGLFCQNRDLFNLNNINTETAGKKRDIASVLKKGSETEIDLQGPPGKQLRVVLHQDVVEGNSDLGKIIKGGREVEGVIKIAVESAKQFRQFSCVLNKALKWNAMLSLISVMEACSSKGQHPKVQFPSISKTEFKKGLPRLGPGIVLRLFGVFTKLDASGVLCNLALAYVIKNAASVLKSSPWWNLQPEVVLTIISRDDLAAESELQIFNAVLSWGLFHLIRASEPCTPESLRQVLEKMIPQIRFPNMTEAEFNLYVLPSEILTTAQVQSLKGCWLREKGKWDSDRIFSNIPRKYLVSRGSKKIFMDDARVKTAEMCRTNFRLLCEFANSCKQQAPPPQRIDEDQFVSRQEFENLKLEMEALKRNLQGEMFTLKQMSMDEVTTLKRMSRDEVENLKQKSLNEIAILKRMSREDVENLKRMSLDEIATLKRMSRDEMDILKEESRHEVEQIKEAAKSEVEALMDTVKSEINTTSLCKLDEIQTSMNENFSLLMEMIKQCTGGRKTPEKPGIQAEAHSTTAETTPKKRKQSEEPDPRPAKKIRRQSPRTQSRIIGDYWTKFLQQNLTCSILKEMMTRTDKFSCAVKINNYTSMVLTSPMVHYYHIRARAKNGLDKDRCVPPMALRIPPGSVNHFQFLRRQKCVCLLFSYQLGEARLVFQIFVSQERNNLSAAIVPHDIVLGDDFFNEMEYGNWTNRQDRVKVHCKGSKLECCLNFGEIAVRALLTNGPQAVLTILVSDIRP